MADAPAEHIVVVDDDTALLALLKRQLQRAGFEVHAFDSGPPALEIVPGLGSCLVVADWNMPGMDGFQVLSEKSRDERIRDIPVIIVSARDPAGHLIVSNTMTVVRGGGISMQQLLTSIEALSQILGTANPTRPPASEVASVV